MEWWSIGSGHFPTLQYSNTPTHIKEVSYA